MRWLRVPIAGLMLFLLPVAVGLAALRDPSELWASALFSLTILTLLASALGMAARRGASRMAFLGFTLFGGSYLILAFGPWAWVNRDGLRPPPLVTRMLLDRIREAANSKVFSLGMGLGSAGMQLAIGPADLTNAWSPSGSMSFASMYVPYDISPYKQIALSMLALVAGILRIMVPREADSPRP